MKKLLVAITLMISCDSIFAQTALNFDGVNDYVLGTKNTSLNLTQGTIEAWIKTSDAGSGYRGIIVKQYNYGVFLNNNKLIAFEWISGSIKNSDIYLNDGIWHHIAFSFNSEVINGSKLYIDGNPVLTFTYKIAHFDRTIAVGNGKDDTSIIQFFNGQIDQVRVWNTIRTDAEILANYKNCLNGNETGIVMLWNFEEGAGTTATDVSGNSNNGSLTNIDTSTNWVSGYDCSNLIAYYPFNGNANDESGNNNHGTVSGATLTTDRFGNVDSAYNFDGNDIISIAHNVDLNIEGELSFSVWVKPTSLINAMVLGKSNYVSNTNYLLRTKSNGLLQFEYKNFANSTNNPLIAGQWNHIAVISQSDNTKKVYINNVLASHTTATSPYGLVTNDLTIGARPGAEYFNGIIDDLRIYKSALSQTEITNLFTNNTLQVDKIEDIATNSFYIFYNTLYFKDTQNLSEIKHAEAYNLLGQKVFQTSKISKEIKLNNLQNGIYILKVENIKGNHSTLKFIIQ